MFSLNVGVWDVLDKPALRICCPVYSSGCGLQFSVWRGKASKRLTWQVAQQQGLPMCGALKTPT